MQQSWAAQAAASAHVFVDALDDVLTIEGDPGHHLHRTLRLRRGETVTAADGRGHWRSYTFGAGERGRAVLEACDDTRVEPQLEPRLDVAFAITKGSKPDVVVQKLTEVGVDRIVLLATRRSVPRWDDARAGAALARLRRVAAEAAAQSRRARLPSIEGLGSLEDVAAHPGLVVAEASGGSVDEIPHPDGDGWLLVVGPEGGLAPDELAALGGHRLRLGPHVLRAETAAIAGAAVLTSRRVVSA